MLTFQLLALTVATVVAQRQGIHCNHDSSCPWYCVGCKCCSGTCWFGAGLTECKDAECGLCEHTARAAYNYPSEGQCNAGITLDCIRAAGLFGPEAGFICPAIGVELCFAMKHGKNPPTPEQACNDLGMCNRSIPESTLKDFAALQDYCYANVGTKEDCKSCFGTWRDRSNECMVKNEKKVKCRKIQNEEFCVAIGCNWAAKKSQCNGTPFSNFSDDA